MHELDLPAGWAYTVPETGGARALTADGEPIDLPPGTRLEAVGRIRAQARAVALRCELGDRLTVRLTTQRLQFDPGAVFRCPLEAFGDTRQAELSALAVPAAPPIEVTYRESYTARFERVEWRAPEDGAGGSVGGLAAPTSGVHRLSAWAPKGFALTWDADGIRIEADEPVPWLELDGVPAREGAVCYQVPRGVISVRKPTFRRLATARLPGRLVETEGALVRELSLTVDGAAGLVGLAGVDTAAGLDECLTALDQSRQTPEGLGATIRVWLLPAWYGLWYDAEQGRETTRETPTLSRFAAAYSAAVAECRPRLIAWLDAHAERFAAGSMAQPDLLLRGLEDLVRGMTGEDRVARIWWSVYLSDLLTAAGDGPVDYWFPDSLTGAPREPTEVSLPALRRVAEKSTPLQRHLAQAERSAAPVSEVAFERLGPGFEQPFGLVVRVPHDLPTGRHEATIRLARRGEVTEVPLVVEVRPSIGATALLGLAFGAPAALLVFAAARLGVAPERRRRRRAMLAQARQRRVSAWQGFAADFGTAAGGGSARGALVAFEAQGLDRALPPELKAAFRAARTRDEAAAAAFLTRAENYFTSLSRALREPIDEP